MAYIVEMPRKERLRIAHLLSQLQPTGAESYAIELAKHQLRQGHKVFMLSDRFHFENPCEKTVLTLGDRKFLNRIRNILRLRRFSKDNSIDILHAHSRAASWVGNWVAKLGGPPLISTVHGRQHIHTSSRLTDPYGSKILVVCENLEHHLTHELRISRNKITVIPNLIASVTPETNGDIKLDPRFKWIGIFGRSSGPKGRKIGEWICGLKVLLEKYPQLAIVHAGGPLADLSSESVKIWDQLNAKHLNRCLSFGFTHKLSEIQAQCSGQIGSGRIAAEGLMKRIPTLASGEGVFEEIVTLSNLETAFSSNFGDINRTSVKDVLVNLDTLDSFIASITHESWTEALLEKLQQQCEIRFDPKANALCVEQSYAAFLS